MKVRFKRHFYIEGHFFKTNEVHEVPDKFARRLPKDAEVLEKPAKKSRSPKPKDDDGDAGQGDVIQPQGTESGDAAPEAQPDASSADDGEPKQTAGES